MTISLTTFERSLRERLLDIVYGQWQQLGAPFSEVTSDSTEVIDPEALLWCSFEFVPTEPRLFETITVWLRTHENYLIRQRLKKRAASADPRARIWHAIDEENWSDTGELSELFHGVESQKEAVDFFDRVARNTLRPSPSESRVGRKALGPSTILLRARDLLGSDVRHFILVYLLANQKGGKLRTIHEWSGYSYRSIFEALTRWQAAGAAVVDHGYGYLSEAEPWRVLLHHRTGRIIIVNWFTLFDEAVRLLRALAKARRKGFDWDNPVLIAHRLDAYRALSSPLLDGTPGDTPSIAHLRELFPTEDRTWAIA